MTNKEYAEKLWEEGPWWCIECDHSMKEAKDAFLHPEYCNEIVCEDCFNSLSSEEESYCWD